MSFISEKPIKAVRKAVQCCACSKRIEVGETATRWTGVVDGEFSTQVYHTDCREAEIALNNLHGTQRFYDDWLGLWDLDWEDHRWLLETYPAVAARKGITLAEIEETEREQEECRIAWNEIDRKRREAHLFARGALQGDAAHTSQEKGNG